MQSLITVVILRRHILLFSSEVIGLYFRGNIKGEDLSYYLKNKDKHYKPQKRKDYENAFEQIEEAIKKDGGDGDSSPDIEDSNVSLQICISVVQIPNMYSRFH